MAATKYTYSVETDFVGLTESAISSSVLTAEILASAIVTALDHIDTVGDVVDVWFKDALSGGDETLLDGLVAAHTGVTPVQELHEYAVDDEERLRVQIEPPIVGEDVVIISHNWCDRCTWFNGSTPVVGEVLSDSGDGLVFNSAHQKWIDLTHGRMSFENRYAAGYLPTIYIDGVPATERVAFASSGGDFQIDYESGDVTFFSSQAGKVITADYHYNEDGSSLFVVQPTAGRRLWLARSEVQFSADCEIKDTVRFQAFAYNPADLPNKIAAGALVEYKTAQDFTNEATGVYPVVSAFGGPAPRGIPQSHYVFPFNYNKVKECRAALGVEIRMQLEHDIAFDGAFATVTLYGKCLPDLA